MDNKRFMTFLILSVVILLLQMQLMQWLAPPAKKPVAERDKAAENRDQRDGKVGRNKSRKKNNGNGPNDVELEADDVVAREPLAADQANAQANVPEQRVVLGSQDQASPYRMRVVLTNRGAAVEMVELNSQVFRARTPPGFLGYVGFFSKLDPRGPKVSLVLPNTPGAEAGLQVDDVITQVNGHRFADDPRAFDILRDAIPEQDVELVVLRGKKKVTLRVKQDRQPASVILPEADDPLSFLLTLEQVDGDTIPVASRELPGLNLRDGNWTVLAGKNKDEAAFQYEIPKYDLRVVKRFRLARANGAQRADINAPLYHLDFSVEIFNLGKKNREVAYRLDGPTGLIIESHISTKISPNWGAAGVRDVVVGFRPAGNVNHTVVSCKDIVDGDFSTWKDEPLAYIGVDAQYFASLLIPTTKDPLEVRFVESMPLRAGAIPDDKRDQSLTDTSCRVISQVMALKARKGHVKHDFQIFAGPKRPALLAQYGAGQLCYYGWFGWVSRPMLGILHFFYALVGNYGVAIVMLTVMVRLCMFPLSLKQAQGAQKMQQLQPEMKKLAEKFKGNPEGRNKAQMELFKKHNYHPLSGCLPVIVQLPIFLGLYRSLAVDIELRGAPLFGINQAFRWCSDLSIPDMLWYWEQYLPAFLASVHGWLGPYFNLLPCLTIGLFLWQQKLFMPPPADEQAALQQKMMKYMMIFMGVMFFKVPSGLCIYFIASSLWGIAERKLLPKFNPALATQPAQASRPAKLDSANGSGKTGLGKRKKDSESR